MGAADLAMVLVFRKMVRSTGCPASLELHPYRIACVAITVGRQACFLINHCSIHFPVVCLQSSPLCFRLYSVYYQRLDDVEYLRSPEHYTSLYKPSYDLFTHVYSCPSYSLFGPRVRKRQTSVAVICEPHKHRIRSLQRGYFVLQDLPHLEEHNHVHLLRAVPFDHLIQLPHQPDIGTTDHHRSTSLWLRQGALRTTSPCV
jgi:hypothetical protein